MATWKQIVVDHTGTAKDFYMQWSARMYLRGAGSAQLWNCPSATYGPNYYQWSSYFTAGVNGTTTTGGIGQWKSFYGPCITVPVNCLIKNMRINGNISQQNRCQFKLKKGTNLMTGTPPILNTISLTEIGSGGSVVFNTNAYNTFSEDYTTGNVLTPSNILIPMWSKNTNLTSNTTRYIEANITLTFEKE